MEKQTELFGGTDIDMLPTFVESLDKLPDIKAELQELRNILWANPSYGSHISGGIHKIRMPISSQNIGKSFGLRIITVVKSRQIRPRVYLLWVYWKAKTKDIPRSKLKEIARSAGIIN